MSIECLGWAFRQEIFSSSHKFVLVALANHAGDRGLSYPAVATICDITSQHDATVRKALNALCRDGFIEDTGKRAGPTQQVKVYRFPESAWLVKTPKNRELQRLVEDSSKTPKNREQSGIQDPGTNKDDSENADVICTVKRFTKPTLDQVKERGKEIDLPQSECEKFFDYYESNGWKVGRNGMKSWISAMANWKRHWQEYPPRQQINGAHREASLYDRECGL